MHIRDLHAKKPAESVDQGSGRRREGVSQNAGTVFLHVDLNDSLRIMQTNVKSAPAKPKPSADEQREQMRRALQTSMDTRQ